MRPGDRMDRVLDLDAAFFEQVGKVADRVLRLRDGHAVARDDDDLIRVREHCCDVVGGQRANVGRVRAAAAGRAFR